ncbi:unnamed protein product [Rotaria magnacalcarata]|uniref:Uncharacterized protein n=1 Tax=Rotaria magnacalcarata TaxID=392030 RepID=A0A815YLW5_9BILA|nr:unnamed protein product [Rotaria magnacalcarata]CAF1572440.1 unnamed protein product [Rotaria magnacalcarata]CAF2124553.1 unnamed protein product [Rotaria magnacalcarata]CAF3845774.1 unnamed protein product [Rotaria magnacalcarata]CAF3908521.1 unnamed protein product [Rotaria magnacalcarata]
MFLLLRRSQVDSLNTFRSLNAEEFQNQRQMVLEDCDKNNDNNQCSVLFDHDDAFYDTIIKQRSDDFEENKFASSEEIATESMELMYSTDEDESSDEKINDEEFIDENEADAISELDKYDNEQRNEISSDQCQREYNEIDISVCLLILKTNHRLTLQCLNDIRKLLIALKVKNVPSSIY